MVHLKKCIGKRWGINLKIARWIYTAVVRPILSYGVVVVSWLCTEKKKIIQK